MLDFSTIVAEHFLISLGGLWVVFWLIARLVRSVAGALMRERTRREIAAYIAEGTVCSTAGERLMRLTVNRGPMPP